MSEDRVSRPWGLAGAGLALGLLLGYVSAPPPVLNPEERALNADLWIQTAAEYRACCLQAYNLASALLPERLRQRQRKELPPAVVMDLDETVFDNSGYQTFLYENARASTEDLWKRWERRPLEVRLVPGALDFIQVANQQGVQVVYISNRNQEAEADTIRAFEHLGIDTKGIHERLHLKEGSQSNKWPRQKKVLARYDVLLWFGDNLCDFPDDFRIGAFQVEDVASRKKAIQDRLARVDQHRARWGKDWIVIPNPVYGEWYKPCKERPLGVMNPTTLKLLP